MKTSVSIPDELFRAADELAGRLGTTRSGLYALALSEFVARYRADHITAQLNLVYGSEPAEIDPVLKEMQARSVAKNQW